MKLRAIVDICHMLIFKLHYYLLSSLQNNNRHDFKGLKSEKHISEKWFANYGTRGVFVIHFHFRKVQIASNSVIGKATSISKASCLNMILVL